MTDKSAGRFFICYAVFVLACFFGLFIFDKVDSPEKSVPKIEARVLGECEVLKVYPKSAVGPFGYVCSGLSDNMPNIYVWSDVEFTKGQRVLVTMLSQEGHGPYGAYMQWASPIKPEQ